MSWKLARDQLSGVIEAIPPVDVGGQLSSVSFKHIPDGNAVRSRAFHWSISEIGTVSPINIRRINLGVTLSVGYQLARSTEQTDNNIVLDYIAISEAMIDETRWNRPTSTIVALSQGGSEVLLSSLRLDENMRFLDIGFEIQVTK